MQAPETVRDRVFIVGAQRCGTTYLYRLLEAHPEISMARPVRPEPKIFLSGEVTDDPQAYDARLFTGRPATRIRGEKTTSYLETSGVARSHREDISRRPHRRRGA